MLHATAPLHRACVLSQAAGEGPQFNQLQVVKVWATPLLPHSPLCP